MKPQGILAFVLLATTLTVVAEPRPGACAR
jgi:hypothetical protein